MIVNFSNEPVNKSENSIFLAGPTSRVNTYEKSWRRSAVKVLKGLGFDGVVYVPEYKDKVFNKVHLIEQVYWEHEALETAGCIVFWVPRDIKNGMPAFTTNVEFGTYVQRKPNKISFGYPEDADDMWYLGWLYNMYVPYRTIYHNLEDTLKSAVEIVKTDENIKEKEF